MYIKLNVFVIMLYKLKFVDLSEINGYNLEITPLVYFGEWIVMKYELKMKY